MEKCTSTYIKYFNGKVHIDTHQVLQWKSAHRHTSSTSMEKCTLTHIKYFNGKVHIDTHQVVLPYYITSLGPCNRAPNSTLCVSSIPPPKSFSKSISTPPINLCISFVL